MLNHIRIPASKRERKNDERKTIIVIGFQVVLGLTLLISCAVALIEERKLLGLGFGVSVALGALLSASEFCFHLPFVLLLCTVCDAGQGRETERKVDVHSLNYQTLAG